LHAAEYHADLGEAGQGARLPDPDPITPSRTFPRERIQRRAALGGLINGYERVA